MEAISTATNFTDPNSGRFVLTAVRIAGEDDYILVDSSDGRRAYRAKFDGYFQSTEVLLPPAFCEVAGHLGDCTIRVDANLCEFKSGTTKVVTRLCEGRFPNLSAVMQRNTDNGEWHTFIFERKPMLAAIKRATLCNTGDRRGVSIAINNSSVVLSGVSDEGKGKANVRCSGHGQVTTMLDEDYVMEFLNCDKQDDIEVTVQSSGSPVFFKTAKAEYVVMPMAPEKPKRQEAEESEEEDESEVAV